MGEWFLASLCQVLISSSSKPVQESVVTSHILYPYHTGVLDAPTRAGGSEAAVAEALPHYLPRAGLIPKAELADDDVATLEQHFWSILSFGDSTIQRGEWYCTAMRQTPSATRKSWAGLASATLTRFGRPISSCHFRRQ